MGDRAVLSGEAVLAAREDGRGPEVVLVHGGMATREAWAEVRDALAGRLKIVSYDLRGHGSSSGPSPASLDYHRRDLAAVIEQLGLLRPMLAGISLGAYIVLSHTASGGAGAAQVLVEGPAVDPPDGFDPVLGLPWLEEWPWQGTADELEARIDHAVSNLGLARDGEHRKYERLADGTYRQRPSRADVAEAFRIAAQPASQALAAATIPTTIVLGRRSRLGPSPTIAAENAYAAAVSIPRGGSLVWLDTGHDVLRDDPQGLVAVIAASVAPIGEVGNSLG